MQPDDVVPLLTHPPHQDIHRGMRHFLIAHGALLPFQSAPPHSSAPMIEGPCPCPARLPLLFRIIRRLTARLAVLPVSAQTPSPLTLVTRFLVSWHQSWQLQWVRCTPCPARLFQQPGFN